MELEQLDVLEKKIAAIIEMVEALKSEKNDLAKELAVLRSENEAKDQLILQLKEENHNLQLLQTENSVGKEREEQIRSRVEQMLAKLDELESL